MKITKHLCHLVSVGIKGVNTRHSLRTVPDTHAAALSSSVKQTFVGWGGKWKPRESKTSQRYICQIHVQILIPEPLQVTLFGKRVIADVIKVLEMKSSSWITQLGLKSNDKCPCKRHPDNKTAIWEKATWRRRQRVERCSPEPQQHLQPREAGKGTKGFSPGARGHLDFGF